MKEIIKKIINLSAFVFACCICISISICTASATVVMGTYTGESGLSVYVRGENLNTEDVHVQIATAEADKVRVQSIEELDTSMQTLVMLDNSLSITTKNQKKIARILNHLVSDRMSNEEICIATFSEEANILVDYTNDYEALMRSVEGISYQKQSTYLTDALYDLIATEYLSNPVDVCRRIIIISDGVDNKSIGYTKEELYSLMKDFQVPVYTIGCKNGKNDEELENMFALSRVTNADHFLLDKIKSEDLLNIISVLKQDRAAVKLSITPRKDQLDGLRKAVKITFQDQDVLTVEMAMPQLVMDEAEGQPSVTDEQVKQVKTEAKEDDQEKSGIPIFVWMVVVLAVIAAAAVIFFIYRRRKNKQQEIEGHQTEIDTNPNMDAEPQENEKVEGFHESKENHTKDLHLGVRDGSDGTTVMLWDQESPSYQVILTDIHATAKSYQVPLDPFIIVGRKKDQCTVAWEDDLSVSGKHCKISVQDDKFYVEDLKSLNGTYLNNVKLTSKTEIIPGSILKLGRLELRFEVRR